MHNVVWPLAFDANFRSCDEYVRGLPPGDALAIEVRRMPGSERLATTSVIIPSPMLGDDPHDVMLYAFFDADQALAQALIWAHATGAAVRDFTGTMMPPPDAAA